MPTYMYIYMCVYVLTLIPKHDYEVYTRVGAVNLRQHGQPNRMRSPLHEYNLHTSWLYALWCRNDYGANRRARGLALFRSFSSNSPNTLFLLYRDTGLHCYIYIHKHLLCTSVIAKRLLMAAYNLRVYIYTL